LSSHPCLCFATSSIPRGFPTKIIKHTSNTFTFNYIILLCFILYVSVSNSWSCQCALLV
jgi:hypothetical protein